MYCDSGDEATKGPFIIDEDAKSIVYTREGEEETLYPELLQPLLGRVLSGYNATVLVSGTHSSGKQRFLHGYGIVKQFYPDGTAVDLLNPNSQDLKAVTQPVLGIANPLLTVMELKDSDSMPVHGLLPMLLYQGLEGNIYTVLLYCIQAEGLIDEEVPRALSLAQVVRGLRMKVSPGHWSPKEAAQSLRAHIREQRSRIVSAGESGGEGVNQLGELIKALQIVKNQEWEKKKARSKEIEANRRICLAAWVGITVSQHGSFSSSVPAETACRGWNWSNLLGEFRACCWANPDRPTLRNQTPPPQNRDTQLKIQQLQEQLRTQMEELLSGGKVSVDLNQERLSRIQQLKEAIGREQRSLKQTSQHTATPGVAMQAKDGSSQLADLELEYTMALNRRKRLKEEHATLIQGELLKMEEELQAEELEVLQREKCEAERDLEKLHRRYSEELDSHRAQSLQVFRAFREAFEEQKDALDRRYRTLLREAIQDAIYLSAHNQRLEAENAQLHCDAMSVKKVPGGSQPHWRDTAAT
ncbi:UNVERIFIED_CONTAM: hypothetical protein FKN15_029562 [Acipenser sinensis]